MAEPYQFSVLESSESKVWGVYDGQTVRFKEEWFVIQSLLKMRVDFSYQVPMYGGSSKRGGAVLDFVCQVPPKLMIIRINGAYWHDRRSVEDVLMKEKLIRHYKGAAEVIDIDSKEVDTQEKSDFVIRKVINGGYK